MAYYLDPNLEKENQNQTPGGAQISSAGGAAAPGSSDIASGAAPGIQNQAQNAQAQKTGSGYINLDNYLNANQGNGFSQSVTNQVQGDLNAGVKQQNQAAQDFSNQVRASSSTPGKGNIDYAVANPFYADPSQYQGWMNQTYQGPTDITKNGGYTSALTKGTNEVNSLNSGENGRYAILNQFFGGPGTGYNFGQQKLDNVLLSGGNFGQNLQNLNQQVAQSNANQNNLTATTQNQVGNAQKAIADSAAYAKNAVQGAIGNQESAINANTAALNAKNKNNYNQLQNDIKAGRLTDSDKSILASLGINLGAGNYGVGLNQLNLSQAAPLTNANTMTPEQQATLQALQGLAGIQDGFAQTPLTQAPNPIIADVGGYNQAVNTAKGNYRSILSNAYSPLNSTTALLPIGSDLYKNGQIDPNADPSEVAKQVAQQKGIYDQMIASGDYKGNDPQSIQNLSNQAGQIINSLNGAMQTYGIGGVPLTRTPAPKGGRNRSK